MRPCIYISRPLPNVVVERAEEHFDVTMRVDTSPMTKGEIREVLSQYDGFLPTLRDPLDGDVFDGEIKTKVIANFGVGYNHIDVAAANGAGIVVCNTPGAVTDATADIAMMLALMTARRASEGEALLRAGKWEGWHPTQLLGMHLGGKTIGIIGMGNIGKAMAKRAHFGFGMDVVFYNRSRVDDFGVPAKQMNSIMDVMGASDVVSLHIPGGGANRHVIGAAELAAMQSHAILVNTARGDVIDEAALIKALNAGTIAGAGLDVFEHEPEVPEALIAMKNVTLLPHLGTASLDVRSDMGLLAVENLRVFFTGDTPPNKIG
ncbi:D-glycerate dehydrogenase [Amylibacter kogurei]|uniref:D-glycerate dehydrogenase n=1 Tax=Paramylibacter kogurei TaxID=1889778 RepID=A0A2G5K3M9_9RHOB|nr:D-glycerate dehydrogenase [Amylibacter kogurei]PIB24146.1 D-glycerate dehydrogenase [Amylibacter kogurei]